MKHLYCLIAVAAISSFVLGCNSSTTPQAVAEKMIDALAKNDIATATQDFDVTMRSAFPPEKLKEVWNQIIGKMGAFQARENVKSAKTQGFDVVLVNCRFEKDTAALQVTVDSAGKISGFFIRPKM